VPDTILTVMAGAVVIAILLLVFPVLVIMGGAVVSAILGESLYRDGVERNQGSELLELED